MSKTDKNYAKKSKMVSFKKKKKKHDYTKPSTSLKQQDVKLNFMLTLTFQKLFPYMYVS